MNLTRDELQVLLWACEHEILRLPSERNEQQTQALLSATTKVREAHRTACAPEFAGPFTCPGCGANQTDDIGRCVWCNKRYRYPACRSAWEHRRCVLPGGHDGVCSDGNGSEWRSGLLTVSDVRAALHDGADERIGAERALLSRPGRRR